MSSQYGMLGAYYLSDKREEIPRMTVSELRREVNSITEAKKLDDLEIVREAKTSQEQLLMKSRTQVSNMLRTADHVDDTYRILKAQCMEKKTAVDLLRQRTEDVAQEELLQNQNQEGIELAFNKMRSQEYLKAQDKLQSTTSELSATEKDYSEARIEHMKIDQELTSITEQISEVRKEITNTQEQLSESVLEESKIQQDTERSKHHNDILNKKLSHHLLVLTEDCEDAKVVLSSLEEDNNNTTVDLRDFQSILTEKQKTSNAARERLLQTQKEYSELKCNNEILREDITRLTDAPMLSADELSFEIRILLSQRDKLQSAIDSQNTSLESENIIREDKIKCLKSLIDQRKKNISLTKSELQNLSIDDISLDLHESDVEDEFDIKLAIPYQETYSIALSTACQKSESVAVLASSIWKQKLRITTQRHAIRCISATRLAVEKQIKQSERQSTALKRVISEKENALRLQERAITVLRCRQRENLK